ncbi:inositol-pentakisphosphate 2-kinase isoform X1 [Plutella xylostella]|uniref:inositol-pentakisphosphate 2-kinase isoform X1 n=1 Tax=Plutella xylostella TaxID=51655 RepID=UPI00203225D6|nr:inositol-pentakisphosphate 2-kinase isoform X1 [Plutella xylostella]
MILIVSLALKMNLLGFPWRYINEGNVHIVLELTGTEYVVRIIKEDDKPVDGGCIKEHVDFVNVVMTPLLSSSAEKQELVEIPREQLHELSQGFQQLRPAHRRHKTRFSMYAIKTLNLLTLNPKCKSNYCIEIKPKEGFMSPAFKETGKCYFCLKQFLKLEENVIENVSGYCPLDLFSGDRSRMKRAVLSLIENPQNNFKLFKDGVLVYNEKSSEKDLQDLLVELPVFNKSIGTFVDFIIEMLMSKGSSNTVLKTPVECYINEKSSKCIEDSNNLDSETFINRLLNLQRISLLSTLGIPKPDNFSYVSKMKQAVEKQNLDLTTQTHREMFFKSCEPSELAILSAILKDCSIMMCFYPNYVGDVPHILIGTKKVSYRISVTDLEPKPLSTLWKREKTEKKLLDIYKDRVLGNQEISQ